MSEKRGKYKKKEKKEKKEKKQIEGDSLPLTSEDEQVRLDAQRRGPLSKKDRSFIFENSHMTDEEIAEVLKRNPKQIKKTRSEREHWLKLDEREDYINALHMEHFWETTKEKLMESEYAYFEESWADLSIQFAAQGILPTDKSSMQDVIITDILLHRHQKEEKDIRMNISELGKQLIDAMRDSGGTMNSDIKYLQKMVDSNRATLNTLVKGGTELQKTKDSKFKDLKATRTQRLDKIEKSGRNFFDLIKLLSEREQRFKEGKTLAISQKSASLYNQKLQEYHEYEDDSVDKPFLLPEEVDDEDSE